MKARYLTAVGLTAVLAVAGCSSSKKPSSAGASSPAAGSSSSASAPASNAASSAPASAGSSASGTLTVWLQNDAETGWPKEVAAANTAFNAKYPNVKVNVEYQTWADHLTKLDAALAATAPDVVELGNTETTKYMVNGALTDITADKGKFDNSGTWLKGLADSSTFQGKLYGVPYYAGARGVIYDKDKFAAAGVTAAPTTLDEFKAAGDKLKAKYGSDPNFSAWYVPGKYWYLAMSFVYGYGGDIASSNGGTWTADLEQPAAQAGLTEYKSLVDDLSNAPKDQAEDKQDSVMAQGHVGMIYGNGWEVGSVNDPKTGNPNLHLDAFPLPGKDASAPLPSFLGGSDLVIPATSKNTAWSEEWINDFVGQNGMTALVNDAKVIPNTTSLLSLLGDSPFAKAATNSWFVPTAKNWADVESQNVLQTMLTNILSNKQSIADATKAADKQIASILNGS